MMKTALKILSLTILLSIGACTQQYAHEGPPPVTYGRATETQIEKAKDRYAAYLLAMDADGVASMYAPDGVMERQSGAPLHGRDEIRSFLNSFSNVKVLAVQMTTISFSYEGPAIVQTGDFQQTARANGKVVNASGRFEATWVQGSHGDWLIRRMVTRPTPPPPPNS